LKVDTEFKFKIAQFSWNKFLINYEKVEFTGLFQFSKEILLIVILFIVVALIITLFCKNKKQNLYRLIKTTMNTMMNFNGRKQNSNNEPLTEIISQPNYKESASSYRQPAPSYNRINLNESIEEIPSTSAISKYNQRRHSVSFSNENLNNKQKRQSLPSTKIIICRICNKECKSQAGYSSHLRSHLSKIK